MNREAAEACIEERVSELQQCAFADVAKLVGRPQYTTTVGIDGQAYQLEVQAFWDGKNLRVVVSADDVERRAVKSLPTQTLIMGPDGPIL